MSCVPFDFFTIYGVVFSHDGKLLAAGTADRKVMLWQLTGSDTHRLGVGDPVADPVREPVVLRGYTLEAITK